MNDRIITATIKTRTPLHTGNGEAGVSVDLPLHRDLYGIPYIPGTHLAGRLREIATRIAPSLGARPCVALLERPDPESERAGYCICPVCDLFGHRLLGAEPVGATASRVWVFDAPLTGGASATLVRDGVGISRRWGAAEEGAKFDIEWLAPGTTFELRVELEAVGGELDEALLALALSEWWEGRGRLGSGAARGGGAFFLEELEVKRHDLHSPDGLLRYLKGETATDTQTGDLWLRESLDELPSLLSPQAGEPPLQAIPSYEFARIDFDLAFDGDLLVGDPAVALAHGLDAAPVYADPEWRNPALPGSSLRGALRAHLERLARTFATRAAFNSAPVPEKAPVHGMTTCPGACDPFSRDLSDALCSCAAREERARQSDPGATTERCVACQLFGNVQWGSRLWIEDAELVGEPVYHLRDFVAIDRFTGGAYGRAKFDALPLQSPVFRCSLLLWEPQPWELAALALALRDLDDGLITLGAKSSVGFGCAAVTKLALTLGHVGAEPELVIPVSGTQTRAVSGVFATRSWSDVSPREWCLALGTDLLTGFEYECIRALSIEAGADSPFDPYFSSGLSELYPVFDLGGGSVAEVAHALGIEQVES